jgi:hypothetical protein
VVFDQGMTPRTPLDRLVEEGSVVSCMGSPKEYRSDFTVRLNLDQGGDFCSAQVKIIQSSQDKRLFKELAVPI